MRRWTNVFWMLGLCAAVLGMTAGMPAQDTAKLGEKVPDFTLTDTNGQERSLSHYKDRIVILEWINPECPDVQHCYKTRVMQETYKKVKRYDKGIVWLAINATPGTTAQVNNVWISMNDVKYPILLDEGGKVRRLYDARRTPQMFVIDTKGVLRYKGAIDNNGLLNRSPADLTNYVAEAVQQIVDEETITADSTKPYGCPIRYAR